jgi:hypothetical protein
MWPLNLHNTTDGRFNIDDRPSASSLHVAFSSWQFTPSGVGLFRVSAVL